MLQVRGRRQVPRGALQIVADCVMVLVAQALAGEPHNGLLSNRAENEAYTFANPGQEYAVYFPNGGSVDINLGVGEAVDTKSGTIRWLNISKSEWGQEEEIHFSGSITVSAPTEDHWAVLIQLK